MIPACDANDDGELKSDDLIQILETFFHEASLPSPWPSCGIDATADNFDCLMPNTNFCP